MTTLLDRMSGYNTDGRFTPRCPEPDTCYAEAIDRKLGPNHIHEGQWEAYWATLTPSQQQSLRDKAEWEHMSVSAVAMEWGAS